MRRCKQCRSGLIKRHQLIFCSNKCQADFQYQKYILEWKKGSKDGSRGIHTKNISKHLKRYLIDKYGEKCSKCDWALRHSINQSVPLEVHHVDGDSLNNSEKNLELLCPNCHSLTPSYKNLNRGKGRNWRKENYIKVAPRG
jgi:5-methylcytosine-specific restriction endonuclease McrA